MPPGIGASGPGDYTGSTMSLRVCPAAREGGEHPAKGASFGRLMRSAVEPDLAVFDSCSHGLTAVAERGLALGALDERNNSGVVGRVHYWSPRHQYDAFRIIASLWQMTDSLATN